MAPLGDDSVASPLSVLLLPDTSRCVSAAADEAVQTSFA